MTHLFSRTTEDRRGPECLTEFYIIMLKSVQSALRDLKRPPERLQSQCNYRPFIT